MNEGIKEQIAKLLMAKPTQVIIKFVRKLKDDPEYDPILALAVITPFLEQDQELLGKVERLIFSSIQDEEPSGEFHIVVTDEIITKNLSDNNMIRRGGRFQKKISEFNH